MLFNILYWNHFIIFILLFFFPNFQKYFMSLLLLEYIVSIFFKSRKETKTLIFFISIVFIILIKQIVLEKKIYTFPIYTLIMLTYFKLNEKIEEKEIISLLNKTFYIYIFFVLLGDYLKILPEREIGNRFLTGINRFIGIEGSPAGPDLLFFNVLLLNIKQKKNKIMFILGTIFYLLTGSLSPIASYVVALLLVNLKKIGLILIFFGTFFIGIVCHFFDKIQIALNLISTNRVEIWTEFLFKIFNEKIINILFGIGKVIEVTIGNGKIYENPHNFYINLLLKAGIIVYIYYFYNIYIDYKKIKQKKIIVIILTQLIYMITNWYILGITANPIIIYILYYYLFIYSKNKKGAD